MSNRVLHPNVLAHKLEHDARPSSPRPRGTGRRLRSMAHRGMTVFQVFLLVFMLAAPAALLAAKPTSTASPSTTDVSGGPGKSGDAKAKAPADTTKAPTDTKSSTKASDTIKSGSSSSAKGSSKTTTTATTSTATTSTATNVTPLAPQAPGGNPAANLDQCANDPAPSSPTDGCATSASQWVNGNLGASKSVYREGDTIPYRLRFTNLASGTHAVKIEWDTTKASKHAIDYITTVNQSVTTANPCLGVTGCSAFSTFTIPLDPQNSGITPIAGVFRLYGGTITSTDPYFYSSGTGFTGDKSAGLVIHFTPDAGVTNPVLAWGGHIATRADWGQTNSAISISGSPYHTRLLDLDGSGGNQDRSLSAEAVIFPATITIIKTTVPAQSAQSFAFTTTGGLTPSGFNLTGQTGSNTQSYTGILVTSNNGIDYTVVETPIPAHWSLTGLTCSVTSPNGGSGSGSTSTATATINLREGENRTCTFTNTHTVATVTIATTLSSETGAIGDTIHDSSALTGATSDAGGSVTYTVYTDTACSLGAIDAGTVTVTNGVVPDSNGIQFNSAGTWYWQATYTGDANNSGPVSSACTSETLVISPPSNKSQITPTATTCQSFNDGSSATLSQLNYSVKGNPPKISQVDPGVFFYWNKVTAVAGSNTFTIHQTITTGNFDSHFFNTASGSAVFTSGCVKVTGATITQDGADTTITFNAGSDGTYIIGVKYDSGSVKGFAQPSPTTVHYLFDMGTFDSMSGLDLVKK